MSEIETNYAAAVAQMLLENKHWVDEIDEQEKADHDEWLYQQRMDKIEQMHDFLAERDNQENEEEE